MLASASSSLRAAFPAQPQLLPQPLTHYFRRLSSRASPWHGAGSRQESQCFGHSVCQHSPCAVYGKHRARGRTKALAEYTECGVLFPPDGGDCEEVIAQFASSGIVIFSNYRETKGKRIWQRTYKESLRACT